MNKKKIKTIQDMRDKIVELVDQVVSYWLSPTSGFGTPHLTILVRDAVEGVIKLHIREKLGLELRSLSYSEGRVDPKGPLAKAIDKLVKEMNVTSLIVPLSEKEMKKIKKVVQDSYIEHLHRAAWEVGAEKAKKEIKKLMEELKGES